MKHMTQQRKYGAKIGPRSRSLESDYVPDNKNTILEFKKAVHAKFKGLSGKISGRKRKSGLKGKL